MSITTVLFDLDGTLLPMDQDVFVKSYFTHLAQKLAGHGYEPQKLIASIWAGTMKMIANDGSQSNEQTFWDYFRQVYGDDVMCDLPLFDAFYRKEFQQVQTVCGFDKRAGETVQALKDKGLRLVLATNPIFPAVATESRMRWAGLDKNDFDLYTTYENSRYSKPNLAYYTDILDSIGAKAEECIMVGNDVSEDMVTEKLGMKVFLMTACLINKENKDITVYPHGGFDELLRYVDSVI